MNWQFYSASMNCATPRWIWVREDLQHGVVEHSDRSFTSYGACLGDALQHGYRESAAEALAVG